MQARHWRNLKVIAPLIAILGVMCATVAYSPTLYRMFCAATGYGGTTQGAFRLATISRMSVTLVPLSSRPVCRRFEPLQRNVTVHLGEQKLVFFTAENTGNEAMVGHATFNVTPQSSGIYFNKIQCFCFSEERLDAHQKVDMPVVFYVDPAFGSDPEMRGVSTITLGYTFFRSANPANAKDMSRFRPMPRRMPRVAGRCSPTLYRLSCPSIATRSVPCSAVWSAAKPAPPPVTIIPPRLRAPARSGPPISSIAGWPIRGPSFPALMPVRVLDVPSGRDLMAYLQKESRECRDRGSRS